MLLLYSRLLLSVGDGFQFGAWLERDPGAPRSLQSRVPGLRHDAKFQSQRMCAAVVAIWLASASTGTASVEARTSRPISELKVTATIRIGKTADWVAIAPNAVWVGSTGPYAVHKIDPRTNRDVLTVKLPGEPCAGMAIGLGSLWVPLCGPTPMLAKIDLTNKERVQVLNIGPAAPEGGVATSLDSVWLVVDKRGTLAQINPATGRIRRIIQLPAGSYNPYHSDGRIWVTRADGAELTSVDARTGIVSGTSRTGPGPRFLTAGAGAVWTLNQRDGSLTRVDTRDKRITKTIALGTPGHGGDISFGGGMVWTTVPKIPLSVIDPALPVLLCRWVGAGGDSLAIGHGAIWLTNYQAGTISRIPLVEAFRHCGGALKK